MALSNLPERVNEYISRADGSEQRQSPVATERHEMEIASAVVASQFLGHGKERKPPRASPAHGAPSLRNSTVSYSGGIIPSCFAVKKKEEDTRGRATRP